MSLTEEQEVLDRLMNEDEPAEVIETILASTAPPPPTVEEKHLEMESKIIRECVREFIKGGMYFAYNFGMYPSQIRLLRALLNRPDITRSLQHKYEQAIKVHKQQKLLAGLGALDRKSDSLPPDPVAVSPLVEPNLVLPLWRRVDKQFWWNEWMSKLFIEAGVSNVQGTAICMLTFTLQVTSVYLATYARILSNF